MSFSLVKYTLSFLFDGSTVIKHYIFISQVCNQYFVYLTCDRLNYRLHFVYDECIFKIVYAKGILRLYIDLIL